MDPHSQVSNKETFCPGQGKGAAIFTADLSPALGQQAHVHMHSLLLAVRRGVSPALVPNKESTREVHANYLTAEGLSL